MCKSEGGKREVCEFGPRGLALGLVLVEGSGGTKEEREGLSERGTGRTGRGSVKKTGPLASPFQVSHECGRAAENVHVSPSCPQPTALPLVPAERSG